MTAQKTRFCLTLLILFVAVFPCVGQSNFIQTFETELPAAHGQKKADILFALITHYAGTDKAKAKLFSDEFVQLSEQLNDPALKAKATGERANLLRRSAQRDSARMLLNKARQMALQMGDENVRGLVSLRLGQLLDDMSNDSAMNFFRQAYAHYRKARSMHFAALALAYQSVVFRDAGRMDSAGVLLDSASVMVTDFMKNDSSYWALRNAAVIASFGGTHYNLLGKYEEGLRWNLQAIRFFELTGDVQSQAAIHHSTGTTYRKLLKYERAFAEFRTALALFQHGNDRFGLKASYESIALVFDDQKQFDSAEVYFVRALDIAEELGSKSMIGNVLNNMGAMYSARGNHTKASEFYERAFEIRGGHKGASMRDRATAMINLGQSATKSGNYLKAKDYLQQGLKAARSLRSWDYEKSALEGIVENSRALGDFRSALTYQDTLITVRDSLYVEGSRTKVAEMEVRYETQKKEQEILLLREQKKFADLEQMIWKGVLLVALTIAGLILYTFWNRKARIQAELKLTRTEKESIQNELTYKDRELVNLATYITEKNNFLESILETIDASGSRNGEAQRQLEKLSPLIRENINISGSRDEFNAHMTTVYGGFIRKLEERYPELTDYEKRLATLLRVNLSSKQIALPVSNTSRQKVSI